MAILGGLFSRKDKSRPRPPSSVTSSAVTDMDIESFNDESEHDHTRLHPNNIYQNAAASSSKMKLPFRRSRSKVNLAAADTPSPPDLVNSSPHPSTQSEPPHGLLPPPRKSAIFGGYGDSGNALSTKSLPNVNHSRSESHETVRGATPASTGKKSGGGLFSWARDRKKSKPPPPPIPSQLTEESFNLRSFRHVGGYDATSGLYDLELPPARPRPRGDSVASDSSQRVSIAAFREMQARRSQTGSPTPQSTSRPSTQIDAHPRSSSPSVQLARGRSAAPRMTTRTSTLRTSSKSDSDSDSDNGPLPLSVQWRSKSELGHSSIPDRRPFNTPSTTTSPQLRQEKSASDVSRPGKKSPMPTSVHAPARPAAIQSRSSPLPPVPVNNTCRCTHPLSVRLTYGPHSAARRPTKDSDTSDSSDSSDDDAPLASLVQPRRPGSAASNLSGRSLPPKPLIDIKSLSNSPLSNSPAVSANPSPVVRPASPINLRNDMRSNINERLSTLTHSLARPKPTDIVVSESIIKTPDDKVSPVRAVPSRSATAPIIVVPSVEKMPPTALVIDGDGSSAPRSPTYPTPSDSAATTPSVNTTEFPPIKNHRASLSLDDPTPIKPTPIHHRVPQSGFSVMSRPQHHSTTSTSISTVPSTSSAWKQPEKEGEPLDSIGDFTAAMFSQFDLDFSPNEGRGSLDSTVKKGPTPMTTTKSTAASSSGPVTPASGHATRTVDPPSNVKRKEPTPSTRPVLSDASPSPPISVSKPETSSGRSVGRPRSSTLTTLISSRPSKPSDDKPQPRSILRTQTQKPAKSTTLDTPAPRKAGKPETTTTPQTQPPPISRHKRVPSTVSTSSESSESSSSTSSVAPKKQKQPQPQLRPQQAAPRPRSSTMSNLISTIPPSPTKSSVLNRPPQRPFAMRNKSPSSSTGDSSSGQLPITPRDGSEIGSELGRRARGKQQTSHTAESSGTRNGGLLSAPNSEMGLKAKKLAHRKSASYDDSTLKGVMRGGSGVATITDEERRRERRRSEAKNAIEVRSPILRRVGRR